MIDYTLLPSLVFDSVGCCGSSDGGGDSGGCGVWCGGYTAQMLDNSQTLTLPLYLYTLNF